MTQFIVACGGICGLATVLELARHGFASLVLDRLGQTVKSSKFWWVPPGP